MPQFNVNRRIPIYFDDAMILSAPQPIGDAKKGLSRLDVGVFYKYDNRNGSYITDEISDMLIESATRGDTPVIGFFDPQSQAWSSHTGPTLAHAYGYVESFKGWQEFTGHDNVTRNYAVFSVVLFTRYYDEANYIVGSNQSMELDINSIQGDWADINGQEYFVYTSAEIMGLCVIGSHEPCFSASSFFEKIDNNYSNQHDKFSSLLTTLASLRAQVEEAEQDVKGGEHQMETNVVTPEVNPIEDPKQDPISEPEQNDPTPEVDPTPVPAPTPVEDIPVAEFEAQIADLQSKLTEMTTNYESAQARIQELEAQITSASETETSLRAEIANYEAERNRLEVERMNSLVEKYETLLTEEEISPIREEMSHFSYNELESKLAICYANKQMENTTNEPVVPIQEPPVVNQFALFMEKYRKN